MLYNSDKEKIDAEDDLRNICLRNFDWLCQ